jgi:hypothetical protein
MEQNSTRVVKNPMIWSKQGIWRRRKIAFALPGGKNFKYG